MDATLVMRPTQRPYAAQGELVKKARKGMLEKTSQVDVAHALGISPSMIYKIEAGSDRPGTDIAHALDGLFGTGSRIFRAYYNELDPEEVDELRGEIKTLRAQLAQVTLDVRSLRASVSQLLDEQEPPRGGSSR